MKYDVQVPLFHVKCLNEPFSVSSVDKDADLEVLEQTNRDGYVCEGYVCAGYLHINCLVCPKKMFNDRI